MFGKELRHVEAQEHVLMGKESALEAKERMLEMRTHNGMLGEPHMSPIIRVHALGEESSPMPPPGIFRMLDSIGDIMRDKLRTGPAHGPIIPFGNFMKPGLHPQFRIRMMGEPPS